MTVFFVYVTDYCLIVTFSQILVRKPCGQELENRIRRTMAHRANLTADSLDFDTHSRSQSDGFLERKGSGENSFLGLDVDMPSQKSLEEFERTKSSHAVA